jgi:hypothetical protein
VYRYVYIYMCVCRNECGVCVGPTMKDSCLIYFSKYLRSGTNTIRKRVVTTPRYHCIAEAE